jgi:hypothetical protein
MSKVPISFFFGNIQEVTDRPKKHGQVLIQTGDPKIFVDLKLPGVPITRVPYSGLEGELLPVINIQDGNWYINGFDTGVQARGPIGVAGPVGIKGDKGDPIKFQKVNSVEEITETLSSPNYGKTIYFTSTGFMFIPTLTQFKTVQLKGEQGEQGDIGLRGEDGKSTFIRTYFNNINSNTGKDSTYDPHIHTWMGIIVSESATAIAGEDVKDWVRIRGGVYKPILIRDDNSRKVTVTWHYVDDVTTPISSVEIKDGEGLTIKGKLLPEEMHRTDPIEILRMLPTEEVSVGDAYLLHLDADNVYDEFRTHVWIYDPIKTTTLGENPNDVERAFIWAAAFQGDPGFPVEFRNETNLKELQWRHTGMVPEDEWKTLITYAELHREIEFRFHSEELQWKYTVDDQDWKTIGLLNDIRGPQGHSIELSRSSTHIQWRLAGIDAAWENLMPLTEIRSPLFKVDQVDPWDQTQGFFDNFIIGDFYLGQISKILYKYLGGEFTDNHNWQYVINMGGDAGPIGPIGPRPEHIWDGTLLSVQNSDGTPGDYVDLKGAKGDQGSVIYYNGVSPHSYTWGSLPLKEGDFYLITEGGSQGELYQYIGGLASDSSSWSIVVSLKGPIGATGGQGEQGMQGEPGEVQDFRIHYNSASLGEHLLQTKDPNADWVSKGTVFDKVLLLQHMPSGNMGNATKTLTGWANVFKQYDELRLELTRQTSTGLFESGKFLLEVSNFVIDKGLFTVTPSSILGASIYISQLEVRVYPTDANTIKFIFTGTFPGGASQWKNIELYGIKYIGPR